MRPLFIILFCFMTVVGAAQNKMHFTSKNYIGLLEGENRSAYQLQTINGFSRNTWFAGLGTGIDWYYRRSIPLFVSLNKDFLKRGNRSFFMAVDGGVNFPWKADSKFNEWGYGVEKSSPGIYWGSGIGYKIGIGKLNDALLLQLGYNYKHIREILRPDYVDYFYGPAAGDPGFTNHLDYHLRRLSLKVGWNF